MGFYQIFIFRVFFSFNAVASVDYFYLPAGRVKVILIFFARGAVGVQNKFEQESKGVKANYYFFSVTSV